MGNDKVIVAIELGSSKISGVAGQKMYDGSLNVLAYASVPSSSCIRHGAVYNLDKTANAIAEVVERLNTILSAKIEKVYVGYNAKGLRSVISKVEHKFEEETVVSQEVLDDMFQQCSEIDYDGYVNLFQESQEYIVDNKRGTETDPMGVACCSLKGNYLNILLKKQVADYIAQCFMAAQVEIVDGYVAPMAQAEAVLTEDDLQQGCALVDYGADTTTVSVYKNGLLRYLRVIPLGSALITRDLSSILKIELEQAEQLKCAYGLCNLIGSQDSGETINVNDHSIPLKNIGDIIEARNEEIIRNVYSQIKARWKRGDGSQLALLSVLAKGDESCCELREPLPKMDAIDNITAEDQDRIVQQDLFTEEGESAQEERDRKEQQKREEAAARMEEETAKEEEAETKKKEKKPSVFKRWYDNFMNMGENFFDDKEEKEPKSENTDN